jgi:hypothetical protein
MTEPRQRRQRLLTLEELLALDDADTTEETRWCFARDHGDGWLVLGRNVFIGTTPPAIPAARR